MTTTQQRHRVQPGEQWGQLTVTAELESRNGHRRVEARCTCGRTWQGYCKHLRSSQTQSCGCLRGGPVDHTGRELGGGVVVERAGSSDRGLALWRCRCHRCGAEHRLDSSQLRDGIRWCNVCPCASSTKPASANAQRRHWPVQVVGIPACPRCGSSRSKSKTISREGDALRNALHTCADCGETYPVLHQRGYTGQT